MLNLPKFKNPDRFYGLLIAAHPLNHEIIENIINNNFTSFLENEKFNIPIILKYCKHNNNIKNFRAVKTYKGYLKRLKDYVDDTYGNFALLRGPIQLLCEPEYLNNEISLTNPHNISIEVSTIYVNILRESLYLNNKLEILKKAYSNIEEVELTLIDALSSQESEFIPNKKDNCLDSIWCILRAFLICDDLDDAIDWLEECGGDIYTNIYATSCLFGAFLWLKKYI